MSIFDPFAANCPHCGAEQKVHLVASLNADRRADLRQQVLDHAFQAHTCEACGAEFRLPPRFTYQHFAQDLWVLCHPRADLAKWQELDQEAADLFAANYGPDAPPTARAIGSRIKPRVVFGWPALREKLVARAAGLDDIELELLKLAIIRQVPKPPFADEIELRLDRVDGDDLVLAWVDGTTEAPETALRVPRSTLDEITADPDWAPLRAQFTGPAFVDLNRLLVAA
jgi:CpXC protein